MMLGLFVAFIGLLSGACLFAFWRGGGPERAVAWMFLAAWTVSTMQTMLTGLRYQNLAWFTLAVDIMLLIGLLVVMRRANRAWPVVVSSLQVLVVLAHGARVFNPHQFRMVYIMMTEFWPYLQLIILIVGTFLHWRRTATAGAEPSWKA